MTMPSFNYEYAENPYIKNALNEELLEIEEAQKQYDRKADKTTEQAKKTQEKLAALADTDYKNFTDPYGSQTDAFTKGGLSQSNMLRGYVEYQNRLGKAARACADMQADMNALKLSRKARSEADKIFAKSEYDAILANDYLQNEADNFAVLNDARDRQYQSERDEIYDERYDREWAYINTPKINGSNSGGERNGVVNYTSFYPGDIERIIKNVADNNDISYVAYCAENAPDDIGKEIFKTALLRMKQAQAEKRKTTNYEK
jgi:hypothetical protein